MDDPKSAVSKSTNTQTDEYRKQEKHIQETRLKLNKYIEPQSIVKLMQNVCK